MKSCKEILKTGLIALTIFTLAPMAFAQNADRNTVSTDTLTTIRTKGELKVGVSVFEPWVMRDKDGELIGYEIEVARKLAEDLGVELKLQPVGFEGLLGDLNANRFDIIITGMYATPERALLVNFTEPLNNSFVELVANVEKAGGADSISDFNESDMTIGFVAGTVYGDIAASKFPKAKTQTFGQESEMLSALIEGKITAAIASTPAPKIFVKRSNNKLKMPLKDPLAVYGESLVVRRGDLEFLNYLNTWVRYYRNSEWLQQEYKNWFVDMEWLKEIE